MTPELRYYIRYLRALRPMHWTPRTVIEGAAICALGWFWVGLGWVVMSAWYH